MSEFSKFWEIKQFKRLCQQTNNKQISFTFKAYSNPQSTNSFLLGIPERSSWFGLVIWKWRLEGKKYDLNGNRVKLNYDWSFNLKIFSCLYLKFLVNFYSFIFKTILAGSLKFIFGSQFKIFKYVLYKRILQ